MKRFMLDTNTVSHLVRKHVSVAKRIVQQPMAALCISAITEAELLYGLARRPEAKRLHAAVSEFLRRIDSLPWDHVAAERYGKAKAQMESLGKMLAPFDMLIASHALSLGLVLVTNDQVFSHLLDLETEDWTVDKARKPVRRQVT